MKYNLYVKYVVNLMLNVDVIKRKCVMALNYILMVNVFYHFLLGKRGGELGNSAIYFLIHLLLGSNVLGSPIIGSFSPTVSARTSHLTTYR